MYIECNAEQKFYLLPYFLPAKAELSETKNVRQIKSEMKILREKKSEAKERKIS